MSFSHYVGLLSHLRFIRYNNRYHLYSRWVDTRSHRFSMRIICHRSLDAYPSFVTELLLHIPHLSLDSCYISLLGQRILVAFLSFVTSFSLHTPRLFLQLPCCISIVWYRILAAFQLFYYRILVTHQNFFTWSLLNIHHSSQVSHGLSIVCHRFLFTHASFVTDPCSISIICHRFLVAYQ